MYILWIILILMGVLIIRTMNFKGKEIEIVETTIPDIDMKNAVEHLSQTIRYKTISYYEHEKIDWMEFNKLYDYLEKSYPLVHKNLKKEMVNDYSLVYHWESNNKKVKPILFTGHLDVVPTDGEKWIHPPFSGFVDDEYIWGRGTLDIKVQVISLFEAIEKLLEEGYKPNRDIYLAFGHDEEIGGSNGAKKIANMFKDRGITFEYILDEGGCVTKGMIEGVKKPVALIGTCEKGYVDVKLSLEDIGGHASMPSKDVLLNDIGEAIYNIKKKPPKLNITDVVVDMLKSIGPEMNFSNRMVIGNLWLFGPIFKAVFSKTIAGNATLRTTIVPTMVRGSDSPNVLPEVASVMFNCRILPGETVDGTIKYISDTVDNSKFKIEKFEYNEPSKISSVESKSYKTIESTVYEVFRESIVSPYLVTGSTDTIKYDELCDNSYRFSPYMISSKDFDRIHGIDERISIKNYHKSIAFFTKLLIQYCEK